jgi:nanoRNase/pAp phosphatase (c-di-AMP/oligoRNAs hydrolase)
MTTRRTQQGYAAFAEMVRSREGTGRWLILTHDNPDPDSIASAAALRLLLRKDLHRRVTVGYGGLIGRAENQEMVRLLGVRMSHVRHLNWQHYRHVALVDTQPRTGNNQLPDDLAPDAVFDHHPLRSATRSVPFNDLRTDYGATATIVAEYLQAAAIEISRPLATALAYAIRTETQDFQREFSPADRKLYMSLVPSIDHRALGRIQAPGLSLGYFRNLHEALEHLQAVGTLVVSHLGELEQPDIVPEIADLLLRMKGRTWSLCSGLYEGRVYLSIRTTNPRADAGHLMRRLVGRRGKGGGHGMMAGGWVEIGDGDAAALQRQLGRRLARALRKEPDALSPIDLSLH